MTKFKETGGWSPRRELLKLEEEYRDKFMALFEEMVQKSGYELGGIEIMLEDVEETDGGVNIVSSMGFYWFEDEEEEKIVS